MSLCLDTAWINLNFEWQRCQKWVKSWQIIGLYTILTDLLTYSMEQSPSWEANRSSTTQESPRILWNPKVHDRIHKCSLPVPTLASSIQSIPTHPTSWRSILILSSHLHLGLPSGLFLSGFPTQTLYTLLPLPHSCYMPRPSHSSRFYHPHNSWWGVQIVELLIMKFSPHPCYLVPLGPNILLNIFPQMPLHVPYGLRGLPSRLWPKRNDFSGWDAHEAQLRCPDEVDGDIWI
jgi:hypothetical protein